MRIEQCNLDDTPYSHAAGIKALPGSPYCLWHEPSARLLADAVKDVTL